MDKTSYYIKRSGDKIEKAGKRLDDAIKIHNEIVSLLTEAVNMFNLAFSSMTPEICDFCPNKPEYEKEGKKYCSNHWKEKGN